MTSEALGLWNTGNGDFHERLTPDESRRIIRSAWRKGFRVFDSAYSYTDSDSILFSALSQMNVQREQWKVIEKIMPLETFERKAESCLRRLHTSYLDILLIHWPCEEKRLYRAMRVLEGMRENGIARETGVSNFPPSLLEKIAGDFHVSYHERPLSLLWAVNTETEKRNGIRVLAYAPLAMGALTGEKKRLSSLYFSDSREYRTLMAALRDTAIRHNTAMASVALQWVRNQNPYMIIRGAGKKEDLETEEVDLSDDETECLTEKAEKVTALATADNMFGHDWKGERE